MALLRPLNIERNGQNVEEVRAYELVCGLWRRSIEERDDLVAAGVQWERVVGHVAAQVGEFGGQRAKEGHGAAAR